MLHHSSSAVALEIWWPSAARHLKYDDQVPYGTWNVLIKCHGTWLSYFKCRAALDHHISSAAWHLVIIFQVPRGTWSSYFKCHGTWWMMQHYYVLYTYMVNTNQKFLNTLRQKHGWCTRWRHHPWLVRITANGWSFASCASKTFWTLCRKVFKHLWFVFTIYVYST